MKTSPSQIEKRKADHLQICLDEKVQARRVTTGFGDISLVHRALPEFNRENINISTVIFDHRFTAPLILGAMTGGTGRAMRINAVLAETVEKMGLGMEVGSQRAAIENNSLNETFSITRKKAPKAFLVANIGGPQLATDYGPKEAKRAVEMIKANALTIHLNSLHEAIQPEGETNYTGVFNKIEQIVQELDVPVIIKETGAGIAAEEAKRLECAGVAGINVAGAGGTSWAAVEYYRAKKTQNELCQRLGKTFWDWGIPTAVSVVEVVRSVRIPVIASGGVRSGVDVAKALALGASLASVALPVLRPATNSPKEVEKTLKFLIEELKNTMFLVGVKTIPRLQESKAVILGKTSEWLTKRGFQPELYARRKK